MNAPARYVCHVTARGSEACRAMGVSRPADTILADRNIYSP